MRNFLNYGRHAHSNFLVNHGYYFRILYLPHMHGLTLLQFGHLKLKAARNYLFYKLLCIYQTCHSLLGRLWAWARGAAA
jgi:hypothetical protein